MKPAMTSADAVDLLQLLENAGIELWLDGGWAVDAALGGQTRAHKDLDIILRTFRCSATPTAMFRLRRTCETWDYSKRASALSCRCISGA